MCVLFFMEMCIAFSVEPSISYYHWKNWFLQKTITIIARARSRWNIEMMWASRTTNIVIENDWKYTENTNPN